MPDQKCHCTFRRERTCLPSDIPFVTIDARQVPAAVALIRTYKQMPFKANDNSFDGIISVASISFSLNHMTSVRAPVFAAPVDEGASASNWRSVCVLSSEPFSRQR